MTTCRNLSLFTFVGIVVVGLVWAGLVALAGTWGGVGVFVIFADFPPLPVTP